MCSRCCNSVIMSSRVSKVREVEKEPTTSKVVVVGFTALSPHYCNWDGLPMALLVHLRELGLGGAADRAPVRGFALGGEPAHLADEVLLRLGLTTLQCLQS